MSVYDYLKAGGQAGLGRVGISILARGTKGFTIASPMGALATGVTVGGISASQNITDSVMAGNMSPEALKRAIVTGTVEGATAGGLKWVGNKFEARQAAKAKTNTKTQSRLTPMTDAELEAVQGGAIDPKWYPGENSNNTIITSDKEQKILFGQRKNPTKNELIGGHSPSINNANPDYAVEVIQTGTDGTQKVKFVTQYTDGKLSNLKSSTLFPESWSNDKIIDSIKIVGDSSPIGVRTSDGAMLYRGIVDGVQIEVIKVGDVVTSAYPTGGIKTELLPQFSDIK